MIYLLVASRNLFFLSFYLQHTFIKNAKPVSILRDLITEAMEIKAKRHEEQQRELEEEDENSVCVCFLFQTDVVENCVICGMQAIHTPFLGKILGILNLIKHPLSSA